MRSAAAVAGAVALAAVLTGCAGSPSSSAGGQETAAPVGAASATAVPSATASGTASGSAGTASATAVPAAAIPTDCAALIASTPFAGTFGAFPLNDPGVIGTPGTEYAYPAGALTPTPAASGASLADQLIAATELRCVWRDPGADVTSMLIEIGTVDPAVATDYLDSLPAEGYTCQTPASGSGRVCSIDTDDAKYHVPVSTTSFLRDRTYIHVLQANVPTSDLLGTLQTRIWG